MKSNLFVKLAILAAVLSGCSALTGEEVARFPINEASSENNLIAKEATLDLKKGDEIVFWSEMDIEYEGNVEFQFRVQITKDGQAYGGLEIDPLEKNVTLSEMKTTIANKTNWSFTGRNTKIEIEQDGRYGFKAALMTSENPTLKIEKAELIIKK